MLHFKISIRCILTAVLLVVSSCIEKNKSASEKNTQLKQSEQELAVLGFTVGKSTINEVKDKFQGKGVFHAGEHGTSVYLLCYKSKKDFFVTFESNELGGRDRILTSIYISSLDDSEHSRKHCAEFANASKDLLVSPGIKLGISLEEVQKMKGNPSEKGPDFLFYEYLTKKTMATGPVNVLSTLELNFENNQLSSLRISKVEAQ